MPETVIEIVLWCDILNQLFKFITSIKNTVQQYTGTTPAIPILQRWFNNVRINHNQKCLCYTSLYSCERWWTDKTEMNYLRNPAIQDIISSDSVVTRVECQINRHYNKMPHAYPCLHIDDILNKLWGTKFISTLGYIGARHFFSLKRL